MNRSALIILDTQVNMFDEEFSVINGQIILQRINELIASAHRQEAPVFFVRNRGGEGDPDEPGTPGFELHPHIDIDEDDIVIDKSSANAFEGTRLEEKLHERDIEKLIVAGMQTEMCVRSTSLAAIDQGFQVTLVEDAHTTFDFEDQSAVEAIEGLNSEIRDRAEVKPTSSIEF